MDVKTEFEQRLLKLKEGKRNNSSLFTVCQKDQLISALFRIEEEGAASSLDYSYMCCYEILRIGEESKLIRRRTEENEFNIIIGIEEVFDVIKTAHHSIGRGGEKKHFWKFGKGLTM